MHLSGRHLTCVGCQSLPARHWNRASMASRQLSVLGKAIQALWDHQASVSARMVSEHPDVELP